MPDFAVVIMQQCTFIHCNSPKWEARGGCWPYLRSAKGYDHGICKHMCGWHQLIGPEVQTEEQKALHICPKCKGPTESIQVAV